jgi:hypothetical protein
MKPIDLAKQYNKCVCGGWYATQAFRKANSFDGCKVLRLPHLFFYDDRKEP